MQFLKTSISLEEYYQFILRKWVTAKTRESKYWDCQVLFKEKKDLSIKDMAVAPEKYLQGMSDYRWKRIQEKKITISF